MGQMILVYSLITAVSLIFCIYFFHKAAGTLHVGRLNLVSISFYLFLLQVFAGVALIMLGFAEHYTLRRLINRASSINTMYWVVMVTAVLWPLFMWLFMKLFKISPKTGYRDYLQKPTLKPDSSLTFWIVLAAGASCLLLLAVYLIQIGYIPLLKMVHHPPDFSFATERINISNMYIVNVYVRNIIVLLAIPVIGYVSFAYALTTRRTKWIILALVFFAASAITKTYNFEKTPLVFHLMVYVLIFIYYKGGIKTKWMIPILGGGFVLVLLFYSLTTDVSSHSLYDGVGGRLLFSQVGALAYNFDAFPNSFPFLMGRSLPSIVLRLLGIDPELSLRSARLMMEFYSPQGVYEGVAGVMNSFYIGEAYANFGWPGVAFSVAWTAFVLSGLFALMLRLRKSPVTLALAAYFGVYVAMTAHGGFVDFIYNVSWIVVIGGLLLLEYAADIMGAIKKRLAVAKEKA